MNTKGINNTMVWRGPQRYSIVVDKNTIYQTARAILHKFGDTRLTEENYYHIHTVQADDMSEDVLLFDNSFGAAFRDLKKCCQAYLRGSGTNTSGIRFIPNPTLLGVSAGSQTDFVVDADGDWTLSYNQVSGGTIEHPHSEYLFVIALLMPHTWQTEVYDSLVQNANDFVLWYIVSDFLRIVEPREYPEYKRLALEARRTVKKNLDTRKPYTDYIEVKPF